jgi:hypothetical protein
MEFLIWSMFVVVAIYALYRFFGFVAGRHQTGRAIEALVIGVKAPQVAQELVWWHLDGQRYMVAAGYLMEMMYSCEVKESRYLAFEAALEIARDICTVDAVTEQGQQLQNHPPNLVRAKRRQGGE